MGARGKRRKRADGSIATGRVAPVAFRGPAVEWTSDPVAAVTPEQLAQALSIEARFLPMDRTAYLDWEAHTDDEDAVFRQIEQETSVLVSDPEEAGALTWRRMMLADYLRSKGQRHFRMLDNGNLEIDPRLLEHAASTPLRDHPEEKLDWGG